MVWQMLLFFVSMLGLGLGSGTRGSILSPEWTWYSLPRMVSTAALLTPQGLTLGVVANWLSLGMGVKLVKVRVRVNFMG